MEYEGNRSAWLKRVAWSQFLSTVPGISKPLASMHGPTDFLKVHFSFLVPPNGVGMTAAQGKMVMLKLFVHMHRSISIRYFLVLG